MKINELIGKKIKDIKMDVRDFFYDGSISLEESNSLIILESGEIFEIPYNNSFDLEIESNNYENQKSIFSQKTKVSLINKVFGILSDNQTLINRNVKNIKGKEIIAVYQYENGYSKTNREWDKCLIEVESGYIISEKTLSPQGTGHTGI